VRDAGDPRRAAIASEVAAQHYGLAILARDIQTQAGNYTRFVEVAPEPATPVQTGESTSPAFKTSVVAELSHEPGALARVLAAFSGQGVDLTKLESRPIVGEPWRYRFYIDVAGHQVSEPVARALEAARADCLVLRVLGSYRAAPREQP
jgi:chorismate mutase/prephenate dehydratase